MAIEINDTTKSTGASRRGWGKKELFNTRKTEK